MARFVFWLFSRRGPAFGCALQRQVLTRPPRARPRPKALIQSLEYYGPPAALTVLPLMPARDAPRLPDAKRDELRQEFLPAVLPCPQATRPSKEVKLRWHFKAIFRDNSQLKCGDGTVRFRAVCGRGIFYENISSFRWRVHKADAV